ncbi:MAG: hypothetical protein AB1631_24625, partial [Acidobacteriota bacterium]
QIVVIGSELYQSHNLLLTLSPAQATCSDEIVGAKFSTKPVEKPVEKRVFKTANRRFLGTCSILHIFCSKPCHTANPVISALRKPLAKRAALFRLTAVKSMKRWPML